MKIERPMYLGDMAAIKTLLHAADQILRFGPMVRGHFDDPTMDAINLIRIAASQVAFDAITYPKSKSLEDIPFTKSCKVRAN